MTQKLTGNFSHLERNLITMSHKDILALTTWLVRSVDHSPEGFCVMESVDGGLSGECYSNLCDVQNHRRSRNRYKSNSKSLKMLNFQEIQLIG